MSLKQRKIAYLQEQQKEIKKSLIGKKNSDVVSEIPIVRRTMSLQEAEMRRRPTIRMQKMRTFKQKQRGMKYPKSKVSIKSFY